MWAILFSRHDIQYGLVFLVLNHGWAIGHKVFEEMFFGLFGGGWQLFSAIHKMLLCQPVEVLTIQKIGLMEVFVW